MQEATPKMEGGSIMVRGKMKVSSPKDLKTFFRIILTIEQSYGCLRLSPLEGLLRLFFLAPNLSPLSRNRNCRFLGAPGNFSAIQASRASLEPALASDFQFQSTDGVGVQSSLSPRRSQPLLRSAPGRSQASWGKDLLSSRL